jgi:hypothetical protein
MLIDELKLLASKATLEGCVVNIWLQSQDAEFKEVFEILKDRPNLNLTEALALIKKYHPNAPFKRTSFVAHLRGKCACPIA